MSSSTVDAALLRPPIRPATAASSSARSRPPAHDDNSSHQFRETDVVRALAVSRLKRYRASPLYLRYCQVSAVFCACLVTWHFLKLLLNPDDLRLPWNVDTTKRRFFWRDANYAELALEETVEILLSSFFISETLLTIFFSANGSVRLYFALDPPHTKRDFVLSWVCVLSILYGLNTLLHWDAEANAVVTKDSALFWVVVDSTLALPVLLLRVVLLPLRFLFVFGRLKRTQETVVASPVDFRELDGGLEAAGAGEDHAAEGGVEVRMLGLGGGGGELITADGGEGEGDKQMNRGRRQIPFASGQIVASPSTDGPDPGTDQAPHRSPFLASVFSSAQSS